MHIPPRFQAYLDTDTDPVERVRKGRGRIGAYRSANPELRRSVRLAGQSEHDKIRRATKALKVTIHAGCTLDELRHSAYEAHRVDVAARLGRTVTAFERMHPDNLDRITVNHIRHNHTEYDRSLMRNRFNTGDLRSAYNKEIKLKCLGEISRLFPSLAKECERQRLVASSNLEKALERSRSVQQAAA
ncbi:hypothetical protein [Arthrobacter sp. A2-55]|uniref:hypothetical protein n=1 Tax=Arthrobacter sp. A2-55 TaxID=2897337 RepID=UPI0021CD5AE9|nr:hypothetical protein [Arthrobacter sp. A2-55]MCU6480186.1 hypothetical protein [Arthrobacter sp. A2-55]